ncbi:hypothetical protein [Variovorax guangxiensis]|uniref:hypothetical protein n=1 Tax=Variovorax guangxiensis TaxID=1775474 RepID=UPI00285D8B52|nr:hypothetical protein [Variovorax guangxiensis]MDR6856817.1 hypothetical protein [Variovorax guangxiensis]
MIKSFNLQHKEQNCYHTVKGNSWDALSSSIWTLIQRRRRKVWRNGFIVITEGTCKHFWPEEAACRRHCFRKLDELFQQYISLDEVQPACFNIFVRACESGLAEYQSTGVTAWGVQHEDHRVHRIAREWSELIKKLHADPRYIAGEPDGT